MLSNLERTVRGLRFGFRVRVGIGIWGPCRGISRVCVYTCMCVCQVKQHQVQQTLISGCEASYQQASAGKFISIPHIFLLNRQHLSKTLQLKRGEEVLVVHIPLPSAPLLVSRKLCFPSFFISSPYLIDMQSYAQQYQIRKVTGQSVFQYAGTSPSAVVLQCKCCPIFPLLRSSSHSFLSLIRFLLRLSA